MGVCLSLLCIVNFVCKGDLIIIFDAFWHPEGTKVQNVVPLKFVVIPLVLKGILRSGDLLGRSLRALFGDFLEHQNLINFVMLLFFGSAR